MALDVRLSRDVDEDWGFQIFGGVDDEMPLTIEKIEPDSAAKRAGLLDGDHILTINGVEAIDMSVEAATRRVEEAGHSMTIGVLRGLYDPVLDDTEPLCYDYEDYLGRQSEPTEVVFQIQQFVEPSDIGSHALDLGSSPGLTESRSLTSSPFVTPTKPYRPFSTEPIVEVPPLEDPIILNPNYRDQFGKSPIDNDPDYLLNAFSPHDLGQSKYKLPISEQYDPDGTRFKQSKEVTEKLLKYERHVKSLSKDLEVVDVTKETKLVDAVTGESLSQDVRRESLKGELKVEKKGVRISEDVIKHEESMRRESKSILKKEMLREEVEEESIREELQNIEKMRQEMDMETIQETAMSVVDESIERAVSVAEEINEEINKEMRSSEVQESESKSVKSEKTQESSEVIDKTETKEYAERKMSTQERTEMQQDGSQKIERKDFKESEISEKVTQDGKDVHRKSLVSEEYHHEEVREESRRRESTAPDSSDGKPDVKAKFKKAAKIVASSVKGERTSSEQKAFTMGLQTIPNIRGTVHSSYHYDLLLKTFFLHLTDVMVALSRFLLSQPAFNQQLEQSLTETRTQESGESKVRKSSQEFVEKVEKRQEATVKVAESKQDRRQLVTPVPVEKKQEVKSVSQKIEKDMRVESIQETKVEKKEIVRPVPVKEVRQEMKVEKVEAKQEQKIERTLTGAQMAQRSDKRLTPEMTQKLDSVISEFETKAVDVSRRSRSRSQIEEEVMKEGDPLEWLDKVDSRRVSMEKTEMSKKEFSSTETTTTTKIPKTPKQTYIAIVESHVYTNKDAIFKEFVSDLSETSSVQSAEEINTATEMIETISAENVAIQNVAIEKAMRQLETAKIVEDSHKLATVTAESSATVQKIEEVLYDTKELKQEEFKKETAMQSTDIQEVVIQETKEIVEPVVEIKEQKIEKVDKVAIGINESLSIAESTEVSVQESKSEFTNVEMQKESVAIVEQEKVMEKIVETKPKVVEPKPIEVVEITETIKIPIREKTPVREEFASLKIVKTVEVDANLSPEIIEVEDISELISKTAISKVQVGDQVKMDASKELSEKSYVSTQIGSEAKKESVVDVSQASQMSVSTDVGALSQAQEKSLVDMSSQIAKRESIVDVSQTSQIAQSTAASIKKEVAVSQQVESLSKSSEEVSQEASFTVQSDRKLSLKTDLERQMSTQSPPSSIDTPTPSTVPPTPLTDEYVFKLSLPLPKSRSATPVPRDSTPTPEDEDPHIVKKHLIPHIETTIEQVVYEHPLPTPTTEPQSPVYTKPVLNGGASKIRPVYQKPGLKGGAGRFRFPVYRKPGLFGGADKPEYAKEEIREIERKSSLLASAIDETIKSIEEYKEEVGIDTNKEERQKNVKIQEYKEEKVTKSYQETYSKEVRKGSRLNGLEEIDTNIEEIIEKCNALASLENNETNNTREEESENTGIVTEVESRKASIEIEVKREPESIIEEEPKQNEKTVKFESEVKIVEVENGGDSIIVAERKDSIPEYTPYIPQPTTQPAEIQPVEVVPPPIQRIPETPVEVQPAPVRIENVETKEEKPDALLGFRPVVFDPENIQKRGGGGGPFYDPSFAYIQEPPAPRDPRLSPYLTETGEQIGTIQGIVDGLEEPVIDPEIAKLLGKPGLPEEIIKPIVTGEDDMLREAHVMGLARVLNSHMHRADDPTSEILPIKPMIGSLKDSEVIKALNEEMLRQKEEERKKEEKKWTTFLQKPKRPVPKAKFGYQGWTADDHVVEEPYKVKIVKQAKPKVAPDYKPEDFETGPLPWEERAVIESSLPPVEPEEPILIPEVPEFLEAVDPLKESEVPDLEDTGIPLPPPREPTPPPVTEEQAPEPELIPEVPEEQEVAQEEEKQEAGEDLERTMAEQLVKSVQKMVDPNASLDQQLAQMRAQLAALAQIPEVIQQSLELVTQKLSNMTHQESHVEVSQESYQQEVQHEMQTIQEVNESVEAAQEAQKNEANKVTIEEVQEQTQQQQQQQQMQQQQMQQQQMQQQMLQQQQMEQQQRMMEEEIRNEKQRKIDNWNEIWPWGDTKSYCRKYRINFMKYQKPPVSLEHLKHSEVYKLIHDEDQMPPRKVEMRSPVMCEADYRERCRSMTPAVEKKHLQIPQQFHP
ncbi:hypothetical protein PYW07_012874 [Mythimna separata]|uniref:PDZ domain-containing protein n=1 Tax=Mythimna separata TaxID=271217 RepID=A0AAD7Y978_MYTSE|nr:hypothetical protein PYW07_012874 [Mythimna separata]